MANSRLPLSLASFPYTLSGRPAQDQGLASQSLDMLPVAQDPRVTGLASLTRDAPLPENQPGLAVLRDLPIPIKPRSIPGPGLSDIV